jgi:hypothetical protein
MRHPTPSLLELSVALTLMSAAPAAAAAPPVPRFSGPVLVRTGDEPNGLVTADFNGDSRPDLATADWGSDSVSVLLGRGDGSFEKRVRYHTSDGPSDLASADLNGDGSPDIVTASNDRRAPLVVFLNDRAGRLRRVASLLPRSDEVVAGDVNGDGVVDLLTATYARRDFAVLLGIGDGRFHGAQIYKGKSEGAKEVALGDLNADGHLDAVLVLADDRLAIRLGAGDGTFGPEQAAPATDEGENMLDVELADLNHDGRLDAATASYYGDVGVFLGRGDGTFAARKSYSTIGKADSVTIADFDSDSTLDLAISASDYVPFVRRGRGDGTFGKAQYLEWVLADYGETADFNQDGRPDLAFVLSEQTYAKVFLNWTGLPAPPCVVLDVTGWRLRNARQYFGFAGCHLGHVSRRFSRRVRRNRVISQALPEGTVLPSHSGIEVVVSRGRRRA